MNKRAAGVASASVLASATTDSLVWSNPAGGAWGTAGNWADVTAGGGAVAAPGSGNAVGIAGGVGHYLNVTGNGAAASLSVSGAVLQWGSLAVGGLVALGSGADLELDGGAGLAAGSLTGSAATLEIGGGDTLAVAGAATLAGGLLLAVAGGSAQFGALSLGAGETALLDDAATLGVAGALGLTGALSLGDGSTARLGGLVLGGAAALSVDATSTMELGSLGGAAAGALTIDKGQAAAASGAILGNLVVNGVLGVTGGGTLAVDAGRAGAGGGAASVSGSGTLSIGEGGTLWLGAADSAAIRFAGPAATLVLASAAAGPIGGFAAGDAIAIGALATSLAYSQTTASAGTLSLIRAGRTVGTLGLVGSYPGALFHLGFSLAAGALAGTITVQTPGTIATQPGTITGTAGADLLTATAPGQVLTGLGGGDTLNAAGFAGVVFRDTSADLSGSVIVGFAAGDVIDITDLAPASAQAGPGAAGQLVATDGTHTVALALGAALPVGYFTIAADGAGGSDLGYVAVNTDALAFAAPFGGAIATAANWQDLSTGAAAAQPPGYGNAVSIAGGTSFVSLTGNGVAASLAVSGDVLLWGSVTLGSRVAGVGGSLLQSGTLGLDGGASLVLTGTLGLGGELELLAGSRVAAGAVAFAAGSALLAAGGSAATLAAVAQGGAAGTIAVDPTSSVAVGAAVAVKGALAIAAGQTADLSGVIDANLVVAGTLVAGGNAGATYGLTIAPFAGGAGTISGGGTIVVTGGTVLTLAVADGVAIQLQPAAALALTGALPTGALPTGTIGGFASGDVITLAQTVTALGWAQGAGGSGALTLYDGAATLGTLTLSGAFNAGQFAVSDNAAGLASIVYAPTPSTAVGAQLSGSADAFRWTAAGGGAWSLAANWTDNQAAAQAAPGTAASVTFDDPVIGAQIVTGAGVAGTLTVYDATIFAGALAVGGAVSVAVNGTVWIPTGAAITAGSLGDGGVMQVAGALDVTGVASLSGVLMLAGGGTAQIAGASAASTIGPGALVAVDALSGLEFGAVGNAALGTLTVDRGLALRDSGVIAGNLLVNGAVFGTGGTITGFGGGVGTIGGGGSLEVDAGGRLVLNAADSAAIVLTGGGGAAGSVLELRGPLPTAAVAGFAGGDLIVFDQAVTGVTVAQIAAGRTMLALTDGAAGIGTLTLAGSYAQGVFTLSVAPLTGFASLSLQGTGGTAGGSGGAGGSVLGTAARIAGTTSGTSDTMVTGNGSYASLNVSGHVLITGSETVGGQLSLGGVGGALALARGASVTAASLALAGSLQVTQASTLTITNGLSLANAQLLSLGGSFVRVRGLVGSAGTLAVDGNSTIDFGTIAAPLAGALNLSSGAVGALAGTILGNLVDPGVLAAPAGGSLFFDMVGTAECDPYSPTPSLTGSGYLQIAEGATLGLGAADGVTIQFTGPAGTLDLAALPTAGIHGFAPGDAIVVDQPVTGLAVSQGGGTTTLKLADGAATLGTLTLAGVPAAGQQFHLDVSPGGGGGTITLQGAGYAATQPTLIQGTVGADLLYATANGQTLTGLGGGDSFNGGGFAALDFRDLTANLNGCVIVNFATSDTLDFTDLAPGAASFGYAGGVLSITDNAAAPHAATLSLSFASAPAGGGFHSAGDGGLGTLLTWH